MFSRRTDFDVALNRHAEALAARRRSGATVLDLTLSNPTDPRLGLALTDEAALSPLTHDGGARYRPDPSGLLSAREAVCAYYAGLGAAVASDRVVLTASTSEAYSWLFKLLGNPGEHVLVPAPSYPLFTTLAQLADVALWPYPEGDLDAIRGGLEGGAVAVIVVHPNNPTGRYVSAVTGAGLLDLCRRHGAALIADEVFFDFALEPSSRPPSFAGQDQALTFTLSGLSKVCGLPGHKLGWIVTTGPEARVRAALDRLELLGDAFLSVATPVQLGLPRLLEQRHAFQRPVCARIAASVTLLGRRIEPLAGGWTGVLTLPDGASDEGVACALLDHGIVVHPGYFYDFDAPRLVVSLLTPEAIWEQALPVLDEVLAAR